MKVNTFGLWLKILARFSEKQITWIAGGALLIGIPVIFMSIALVGILQVENSFILGEIDRAVAILENEIDSLDQMLVDWSAWDDTYLFAQTQDIEYVDRNISVESMTHMGIDYFLLIDMQGRVVLQRNIDRVQQIESELPFAAHELRQAYPILFDHPNLESSRKGLVAINGKLMMLASRPIITSSYQGPAAGILVFGVLIDRGELEILSRLTRRDVLVHSLEEGRALIPTHENMTADKLENSRNTFIRPQSGRIIAGYRYLDDILGKPVMVMQLNSPRELYHQSLITGSLFLVASILLGAVLFSLFQSLAVSSRRAQNTSREYLARYQAVVHQSTEAILMVDQSWRILEANPASLRLLGFQNETTIPLHLLSALKFDLGDDQHLLEQASLTGKTFERRCIRRDGRRLDVEISASKIDYLGARAYSLIIRDITSRKDTENALRASEERYFLATRGANDGLWDWNLMTDEIYLSARWKAMLGYLEQEIGHSPYEWFDRIHPEDRIRVKSLISEHISRKTEHFECEHRMLHKDGKYRWMLTRAVAVWSNEGTPLRIAGSQTDITERKMIEEQLRYDALHDGLTGLANRTLLLDRLRHVNDRKRRIPEMIFALFFLDFDRFKQINDMLGHQYGDLLLIEASRRLETCLRSSDTVARFSGPETLARIAGDEFVILLEDLPTEQEAHLVADRVRSMLNQPFNLMGKDITVSVSIGIVVPDHPCDDPEEIIRSADIAMYSAKQRGGSQIASFTRDMFEETAERLRLESELHHALDRQEFKVLYQPIFALADDRVIGFEALLRWGHSQRGLLSPSAFIDVAEEAGLMVPIGYWVLQEACQTMHEWQLKFGADINLIMSVNMSTRQLADPNLLERVRLILELTHIDPACLWLEVTEDILIHNMESLQTTLRVLRNMGIKIKIDDFGIRYSSLGYLHNLEVDGYKIDRSFVQDLDGSGQRIVDFLVSYGQSQQKVIIAEGVETREQKEYLKNINCDYMQGFLMYGPLTDQHVDRFLSTVFVEQVMLPPEVPGG